MKPGAACGGADGVTSVQRYRLSTIAWASTRTEFQYVLASGADDRVCGPEKVGGIVRDVVPNRPVARMDMVWDLRVGFTCTVILLLRDAMLSLLSLLSAMIDIDRYRMPSFL